MSKKIELKDIVDFFEKKYLGISNIIIDDYNSYDWEKYIKPSNLILASRSDAYLSENYFEFTFNRMLKYIAPEGIYISDGILSNNFYELYYEKLVEYLYKKNREILDKVYFIIKKNCDETNFPIRAVWGLVVKYGDQSVLKKVIDIEKNKIVNAKDIMKEEKSFLLQIAWTNTVRKIGKSELPFLNNEEIYKNLQEEKRKLEENHNWKRCFLLNPFI
jgi:hypothetical protein